MPMPELPGTEQPTAPAVADLARLMRGADLGRVGGTEHLPIAPNEPFFLRHHPRAWQVSSTLDEVVWLPEVLKHVLSPGVNGVRTISEGDDPHHAYEDSVHQFTKRGWIYLSPLDPIPAHCLPPGVPADGGYLRELPCRHPLLVVAGVHYVEAWHVPVATLPDEPQQFVFHRESYEQWLRYLVVSGQVAPPKQRIVDQLITRVRGHLERARTLNLQPDLRDEFVAKRRAVLAAYEAARTPVSDQTVSGWSPPDRRNSFAKTVTTPPPPQDPPARQPEPPPQNPPPPKTPDPRVALAAEISQLKAELGPKRSKLARDACGVQQVRPTSTVQRHEQLRDALRQELDSGGDEGSVAADDATASSAPDTDGDPS